MKALIVDIEGEFAVAMTKEGTFIKLKNTGKYTIGCEAELPPRIFVSFKLMASAASAALLILVVGLGFFLYNNPYSYINIDINPSIQITANIFDRIIDVTALNGDAQKIANELSIKNKKLDQGVEQVVGSAVKNGYLKDEKTNAIMLTVTSTNDSKNKKLKAEVAVTVEKKFKSEKISSEVVVDEANEKSRSEAIKQGISPGKLKLVKKLIELKPDLKADDLKNKPVKDILKSIRDNTKSQKPGKPNNNNNNNNPKESGKNSEKVKYSPKSGSTTKNIFTPLPSKDNDKGKGNDKDKGKDKYIDSNKDIIKGKGKDKEEWGKNNSDKDNGSKTKTEATDSPKSGNNNNQIKNGTNLDSKNKKNSTDSSKNNTIKIDNGNFKEKSKADNTDQKNKQIPRPK